MDENTANVLVFFIVFGIPTIGVTIYFVLERYFDYLNDKDRRK